MRAILANPFISNAAEVVMPSAEQAAVSNAPLPHDTAAATRFDRYFDPDKFLRDIGIGCADMTARGFAEMTGEDVPLFIGAPSDDFIAAVQRDVLPLIEDYLRRAG